MSRSPVGGWPVWTKMFCQYRARNSGKHTGVWYNETVPGQAYQSRPVDHVHSAEGVPQMISIRNQIQNMLERK